jgi:tetratricopeptide (TPR) repeat protein
MAADRMKSNDSRRDHQTSTSIMLRAVAYFSFFLLLSTFIIPAISCARREKEPGKRAPGKTEASSELMTCLAMIKAHHKQTDIYLKMGDFEKAIDTMEKTLNVTCPKDAPETWAAFLDAHARLAELYLKTGKIDQALETARKGLQEFPRDSFFRAHLLMTYADILEAKGESLDAKGDKKSGDKLRRQAIESLTLSIEINRRLQKELLEEN